MRLCQPLPSALMASITSGSRRSVVRTFVTSRLATFVLDHYKKHKFHCNIKASSLPRIPEKKRSMGLIRLYCRGLPDRPGPPDADLVMKRLKAAATKPKPKAPSVNTYRRSIHESGIKCTRRGSQVVLEFSESARPETLREWFELYMADHC